MSEASKATRVPGGAGEVTDSRAEVGRKVRDAVEQTGLADLVQVGPVDLPGLPPRGIRLATDRVAVHLLLRRLPVGPAAEVVAGAIGAVLAATPWAGARIELHIEDLHADALDPAG